MAFEPENILKGRIGECLVEELLKKCGNKVYRFGYEAVLQNLTQLEKSFDRESEVGQRIKSIPDFIAINKEGRPFLIEVKFRTELSIYDDEEIKKIGLLEKFWKAKIVVLTLEKPYFRVSTIPYLDEKGKWNWKELRDDKDLFVDDTVLDEFNKVVEKYFKIQRK